MYLWQLRGFLGLASYYCRFIEDFSKLDASLNLLLKKGENYIWTSLQQEAFQSLKEKLTSAPVLAYPNFDQEFLLFTNALGIAISAILSQKDAQGREKVISYAR
ncbi:20488_t:CDS:1 [Gigaspora rosea]|nr:20488_t:CDS:1 [Gigaspora rosea]